MFLGSLLLEPCTLYLWSRDWGNGLNDAIFWTTTFFTIGE
jgi:hypothetical protein